MQRVSMNTQQFLRIFPEKLAHKVVRIYNNRPMIDITIIFHKIFCFV